MFQSEPERSAGAVVIDRTGRRVLMVRHVGGRGWGFPKGHIEPRENARACAAREVEEETGLPRDALRFVCRLDEVVQRIHYPRVNESVTRTTQFYLCVADSTQLGSRHDDAAHDRAEWMSWSALRSVRTRYSYVLGLAQEARKAFQRLGP